MNSIDCFQKNWMSRFVLTVNSLPPHGAPTDQQQLRLLSSSDIMCQYRYYYACCRHPETLLFEFCSDAVPAAPRVAKTPPALKQEIKQDASLDPQTSSVTSQYAAPLLLHTS